MQLVRREENKLMSENLSKKSVYLVLCEYRLDSIRRNSCILLKRKKKMLSKKKEMEMKII